MIFYVFNRFDDVMYTFQGIISASAQWTSWFLEVWFGCNYYDIRSSVRMKIAGRTYLYVQPNSKDGYEIWMWNGRSKNAKDVNLKEACYRFHSLVSSNGSSNVQ